MKDSVFELTENYLLFSHFWFATPQDVLQADWQEVWHSPQPPLLTVLVISLVSIVLILFMVIPPKKFLLLSVPLTFITIILSHYGENVKSVICPWNIIFSFEDYE